MSYRVELTDGAYADLERLTAAVAEKSPDQADRLLARFHQALPRLEHFPFTCGLAYEERYFPFEVRHLLFEVRKGRTDRALFLVRDDAVIIVSVRAPGEKPVRPGELDG